MQSEMPESFRELCARAQKENDLETVAEIVDRLLQAVNEKSKAYSEPRNLKAGEMNPETSRASKQTGSAVPDSRF